MACGPRVHRSVTRRWVREDVVGIMEVVVIALVIGTFGLLGGALALNRFSRRFAERVSSCPACGNAVRVSPDPKNSRLVLHCANSGCEATSYHPVRASFLSLFGLARLILVFLFTAIACLLASRLGWGFWVTWAVTLAGLLVGWAVASSFVRLCAQTLLARNPSPIVQKELVAHLAPPPRGHRPRKDDRHLP